jgi:hypothetical protein
VPDLVDAFFKRDLTEAEQEALSRELLNSDKAALKFESKAKALYLSFGLAVPIIRWPKQGKLPWHTASTHPAGHGAGLLHHWIQVTHLSHWIWPSLFVVGVMGSVATWHHLEKTAPPVEPVKVVATSIPVKRISAPQPISVSRQVTPVALTSGTPPVFASLSVEVSQAHEGQMTVRVLEMTGQEVLGLYQGDLKAGDWVFTWDGKLLDGSPAKAGFYRIEIQSGAYIQRKIIQIQ